MNLSLYSVNAFIVLDTDGHRVLAKYYSSKARTQLGEPDPNKGLQNLKEQRAFEKGLFAKTKKPGGTFGLIFSPFTHVSFVVSTAQVISYYMMDT